MLFAQFTPQLMTTTFSDQAGPYTADQYQSIKYPDLNGDGVSDMCFLKSDGVYCTIFAYYGGMIGEFTMWTNAVTLSSDPWERGSMQYLDIDNDRKEDLCLVQSSGATCLISDGAGRLIPTNMRAFAFGSFHSQSQWQTVRFLDFNRDGRIDVCGRDTTGMVCQMQDSVSRIFLGPTTWISEFTDLKGWGSDPAYYSTIQYADVDLDGRPDVCGRATDGVWCAFNSGTKFDRFARLDTDFSDANGWNRPQYYSTIHLADINGDGRADLCGRGTGGMICGVYIAPHRGCQMGIDCHVFAGTLGAPVIPFFSDANGWNNNDRYLNFWLVDINGDHKADVCGRAANGVVCAISLSGTAAQFGPAQTYINGFTDLQEGFNFQGHLDRQSIMAITAYSVSYWSTVQPVKQPFGHPTLTFCGRQSGGIYCGF